MGPGRRPALFPFNWETFVIELRDIVKTYSEGEGARRILDGLNWSVVSGDRVALMGKSGSGKSTLLNLLSGIDLPDSGTVLVDGQELSKLDERSRTLFRRERIGFVFQFFNLIPTLTVAENVRLPLELNSAENAEQKVMELLDRVGLQDRAETYPDKLSGGEQQRVAVARALVHRPALVLADEPTGNLDASTSVEILRLLNEMAKELGQTVVMATHSSEASATAARTYLVSGGSLELRA